MSRLYTQHYFPNLERGPGTRVFRQVTLGLAIGSAAALAVGFSCYAAGVRVNTSRSIPVGIYLTSSAPVNKGAYVLLCPPPGAVFEEARQRGYIGSGLCPGGYGYMMKKVLAAKADAVTVADDGVRVNGELLPLSAPLKADKAGRPLPRYQVNSHELGKSEVLLMSDVSSTSFDSRYFGPIHVAQIKSVIEPVFVWQ